jgi:methylated-DNA-[protein]-cysteine S-methyltransferase
MTTLSYDLIATPIGRLLLAATECGLVRVGLASEDPDEVLAGLAADVGVRPTRDPHRLAPAVQQFQEYFAGRRQRFDLALDLSLSRGFRRRVLEALLEIGYGEVESYSDLARRAGSPRAARAVGSACATNPLPIVVPCHRVVRADGSVGGYGGGLDVKTWLLDLERRA